MPLHPDKDKGDENMDVGPKEEKIEPGTDDPEDLIEESNRQWKEATED